MHVRCLLPFPDTRPLSNQLRGNRVIRWSRGRGVGGGGISLLLNQSLQGHLFPPTLPPFPSSPFLCPLCHFKAFCFFFPFSREAADAGRLDAKQVRPLQLKLPEILKRDDESAVSFRTHPLLDMLLRCRVSLLLPRECTQSCWLMTLGGLMSLV